MMKENKNMDELIIKHLCASASQTEVDELLTWVEDSEENRNHYLSCVKIWQESNRDKKLDKKMELAYTELQKKLNPQNGLKTKTYREFKIYPIIQRAAMILILLTLGFSAFYLHKINKQSTLGKNNSSENLEKHTKIILSDGSTVVLDDKEGKISYSDNGESILLNQKSLIAQNRLKAKKEEIAYNEIYVPFGHNYEVTLSDNSHVWLNSGSWFKFPVNFTDKQRNVELMGEAYFDVFQDKKRPFLVKANLIDIKVIGTEFNVTAFEDDDKIETTLVEGKVEIRRHKGPLKSERIILKPNQKADLDIKNDKILIQTVDTELYTSWKDGYFKFADEPFEIMAKIIERNFGIQVQIMDDELKKLKISGSLRRQDSPEKILSLIAKTNNIKYEITKDKIIIRLAE